MLKMQKWRGKVDFKTVWHLDQNENLKKNFTRLSVQSLQKITVK